VEPGGRDWLEDRIRGCLGLAALGDAVGAPFEGCTRDEVATFGDPLNQPSTMAGLAQVTDDTGQLDALVRVLIESRGEPSEELWRAALLDWFANSPTAEKAGPTSSAMLEGGPPPDDPRIGITNGSAMRAAPCGLVRPGDPEAAVELAWRTSRPTHRTQVAAAAAGAIAAGVAVALRPGSGVAEVTEACVLGAALGHGHGVREGRIVEAPRVSARIELALDEARGAAAGGRDLGEARGAAAGGRDLGEARAARDLDLALERIEAAVGTSMLAFESVPAAVGVLAAAGGDPLGTISAAVRIGGDTDTIAAMAGALAGALNGYASLEPDDRSWLDLVLAPGDDDPAAALAEISQAFGTPAS
jgi:ADP-ribosylglycohydrolase